MKTLLRAASIAILSFTAATGTLFAATNANVSEGTFNLAFNKSFLGTLSSDGVTVTYLKNEGSAGTHSFQVEGGIVDRDNGSSEVQSVGGVQFKSSSNGTVVQLQRLALESNQSSSAKITALVIINGQYVGRRAVFTITSGPQYTFPLKNGEVSSGDISFKVNKAFADEIGDYFPGAPSVSGNIGEISLDLFLSPE